MCKRTILYGYRYKNGLITIDTSNAEIVKEIFGRYINGESLLQISNHLTALRIEYRPGVTTWDKSRIKRIIEEKRYVGNIEYPQIISEEIFEQANGIKNHRNTQKGVDREDMVYRINSAVICPCCNGVMKRYSEPHALIHERWRCQSPDCKKVIGISDKDLLGQITDLINIIINQPDTIKLNEEAEQLSKESIRIQNEINRMLDRGYENQKEIRDRILELVSVKYNDLNTKKYEIIRLRDLFERQHTVDELPIELFNRAVKSISFDSNNNVTITLINGQVIRKENGDGSAKKEGNSHRADDQGQRGCQRQIPTEASCCLLPCLDTTGRTA